MSMSYTHEVAPKPEHGSTSELWFAQRVVAISMNVGNMYFPSILIPNISGGFLIKKCIKNLPLLGSQLMHVIHLYIT